MEGKTVGSALRIALLIVALAVVAGEAGAQSRPDPILEPDPKHNFEIPLSGSGHFGLGS
jgi:hypothetical protein